MNTNNVVRNIRAAGRSAIGKVSAGAAAMVATGTALASGGPAEAVVSEITSGKASVSGILVVLAGVLGLFLLWSMIKRAK